MAVKPEVLESVKGAFIGIPGVIGVGAAGSSDHIIIYVEQKTPELEAQIPQTIAGYNVEIKEKRKIVALAL